MPQNLALIDHIHGIRSKTYKNWQYLNYEYYINIFKLTFLQLAYQLGTPNNFYRFYNPNLSNSKSRIFA